MKAVTVKWQVIRWSDELTVEITGIDSDHKHLVQHLDTLFSACQAEQGADVMKKHLLALQRDTREHFAHEEDFMSANSYPQLHEHRAKHAELISELDDLLDEFDFSPAAELTQKTLGFLQQWLLQHILVEDKKIGHHMGAVY